MATSDQCVRDAVIWQAEALVLGLAERLIDELCDVGAGQAVVDVSRLAAGPDHFGISQKSEVTADSAVCLLQCSDQFGHAALALYQKQDKLDPDRFGEGLKISLTRARSSGLEVSGTEGWRTPST